MKKSLTVFGVAVILILSLSSNSLATVGNGVALTGDILAATKNPAGLFGLDQTEFRFNYSFNNDQSNDIAIYYAEPSYGEIDAGLLSFKKIKDTWNITYGVTAPIFDISSFGIALSYLSYPTSDPEQRDQYVTTNLGAQVNYWILRLGIVLENALYLSVGDTEESLNRNVISGLAVDLLDYGVLTVEVNDTFNQRDDRHLFIGTEINPIWDLYLRVGWGPDWTAGIGYQYDPFILNYDWKPDQHQIGISFVF